MKQWMAKTTSTIRRRLKRFREELDGTAMTKNEIQFETEKDT